MTPIHLAHCASSLCAATADQAFAYLSDPSRLGEWALGCWGAVDGDGDLVCGTSRFDGTDTFARLRPHHGHLIVDFEVGDDPKQLVPRITARVVPGDQIGEPAATSLLLLTAWRVSSMDDHRWQRLVIAHDVEILLLRHRIETWIP